MRREVKPEPVPPPKEWKMRNPWSPVHWSDNFRILSRTRSTISLPVKVKKFFKLHISLTFNVKSCWYAWKLLQK